MVNWSDIVDTFADFVWSMIATVMELIYNSVTATMDSFFTYGSQKMEYVIIIMIMLLLLALLKSQSFRGIVTSGARAGAGAVFNNEQTRIFYRKPTYINSRTTDRKLRQQIADTNDPIAIREYTKTLPAIKREHRKADKTVKSQTRNAVNREMRRWR